ncbi:MAG: class I SAM-dependent methyltransferase [Caldilineaceae bacterium]
MQSQHVDEFNHDPWAAGYDEDVRNEADPIRAGYAAVLDWVVASAQIQPQDVVIDLGIGTGNTSQRIAAAQELIGVDISTHMMALARPKLAHLPQVTLVQADLLGFFAQRQRHCDALFSTYAIHHLTDDEKALLFRQIWQALAPGRRAVFGDLMFADAAAQSEITQKYAAAGDSEMVETFAEEFFWQLDLATYALHQANFHLVEVKRFSELSWGVCVEKPIKKHIENM